MVQVVADLLTDVMHVSVDIISFFCISSGFVFSRIPQLWLNGPEQGQLSFSGAYFDFKVDGCFTVFKQFSSLDVEQK